MNGGFNPPPPPAPDNSSILAAAASHEAGPSASEPNSHVLAEARQRLHHLREVNTEFVSALTMESDFLFQEESKFFQTSYL